MLSRSPRRTRNSSEDQVLTDMSSHSAYQETIEYLFGLQKHGIKLGLSNSIRLLELMGAPHRSFRSVHIAGTNGKGSTAAFITSMLQAAGYRVGLYTSPHLVNFTERMRINGVQITETQVVELAERVRELASRPVPGAGSAVPTFFEVTTAMAFTWFAEEQVDLAVIEVGMGGRLDATNVITPAPVGYNEHRPGAYGISRHDARTDRRGKGGHYQAGGAGGDRRCPARSACGPGARGNGNASPALPAGEGLYSGTGRGRTAAGVRTIAAARAPFPALRSG